MQLIRTNRLDLHHIGADDLINLFETRDDAQALLGEPFKNPLRVLIDFQGPLAWRVPQVKADPSVNKWFVRWAVLRSTQEIIGSSSFHAAPDENGMIEIGLGVETPFQRQGFGREILQGMWGWVVTEPGVKVLRYTVSPTNTASIALVNSFGFDYVGEQQDEEDGPESIYEMSADDYRKKFVNR
ncbi:MAG: N-acetyltransferase [Actinobacteria bacterium]|jgi:[ribosomal protein S5]-alanine N-acetyltransferase|nr:N-acetyltransferase [Actinomycetota bacterium]NDA95060.1 N-acetyltransferase [Actinomycetota bacterium]NDH80706.1 N-acetyltransferase [Actinomycetota bacterium]NDH99070.1 N-acetyltransferase [Actinomycetota bacterium]